MAREASRATVLQLAELPLLPRECDAASTALYVQAVASGEKPVPKPLQLQVQALLRMLAALDEVPLLARRL